MLRTYQRDAITQIRDHYKKGGKRAMLHMPVGSGKTATFCEVLKGLHMNNKPGLIVVRGRKLVDQASQRLAREGVPHGVFMANHKGFNPNLPIQVASIDTLRARDAKPRATLIVIDEAHFAVSPSFKNFLEQYPDSLILSVTATPFTKQSLRHLADVIISPITISELLAQGFLVDARYFAPRAPDLSKISISRMTGDYDIEELEELMKGTVIVGDTVTEWKRLGENRSTLVFCVSVNHSLQICEAFNKAGIKAEHVDASINDRARDQMIARLERGETKVITSIGTMTTGVDIPSLGCLVFTRPTKSYSLYVQMLGRGTRPFPGKEHFIVLDHAGNLMRHGALENIDGREVSLDGKEPEEKLLVRTCEKCFAVFPQRPGPCPNCGYIAPKTENTRELEQRDGELAEYVSDPIKARLFQLRSMRAERKYNTNWVWYKMRDEFGEDVAEKYCPRYIKQTWKG